MTMQSLNGQWMRRIGAGEEYPQQVPYSTLPVGRSVCRRTFVPQEGYARTFLKFDGITYHAWVSLNGAPVGEMLPYCEYEFELTDLLRAGENELTVEIEDINLSFGPTPGWENFGGIIRDVSLIYREENYLTDVFFRSTLINDYRDAEISVEVQTDRKTDEKISIELQDGTGKCVLSWGQAQGETETKTLSEIRLWSPDSPELYSLTVSLTDGGRVIDQKNCMVGFRELTCSRHRFLLNGRPLFLKGVCRHEMIGDSGHVVSPEQIEADMRMIKSTGANFVRLVHYPHCRATLDIADRLGLMVSEEPGLWWSDTANEEVAAGSLEVLRRTILRDRNHPSIVFWLSFNECRFTEKFLIDSAQVCRKYDPTRLVSGANCMSDEDTLVYFNRCGFDFYTMHPYSPNFDRLRKAAQVLHDKPLLFTEWGGYFVFDNPAFLRQCMRGMAELYRADSDEGALAGAFLWCWADVHDFNRGMPCVDGVLPEGLVTMDRQKHICFDTFCDELARMEKIPPASSYRYRQLEEISGEMLRPVSSGGDFAGLAASFKEEKPSPFNDMRRRQIKIGPRLERQELPGMDALPRVLTEEQPLVYACGKAVSEISLLGLVSISRGWPVGGDFGQEAAVVTVYYADGGEERISLRNGREITTVFTTLGSSRIDPRADRARRFAEFSYDKNFEQYLINRLDIPLDGNKITDRVEISSSGNGVELLFYGVNSVTSKKKED